MEKVVIRKFPRIILWLFKLDDVHLLSKSSAAKLKLYLKTN